MIRRFALPIIAAGAIGLGGFALGGGFADDHAPRALPTIDSMLAAPDPHNGLGKLLDGCDGAPVAKHGQIVLDTSYLDQGRREFCIEGLTRRQTGQLAELFTDQIMGWTKTGQRRGERLGQGTIAGRRMKSAAPLSAPGSRRGQPRRGRRWGRNKAAASARLPHRGSDRPRR